MEELAKKQEFEGWLDQLYGCANLPKWVNYIKDIPDLYLKLVTSLVLENQSLCNKTNGIPVDNWEKVIVGVIPNLLVAKIASIQPMFSPGNFVYFRQWYSDPIEKTEWDTPKITLKVFKNDVLARTRKYKSYQNEDHNLMISRLKDEIDKEVLFDLSNNAGTVSTFDPKNDELNHVFHNLNNCIFRKTMKTNNKKFIVIDSEIYEKYKNSYCFSNYILHIVENWSKDKILMGNIPNTFLDSGYFYCPYVFITKTLVFNSPDFCPRNGYLGRYAKCLLKKGAANFGVIKIV